MKKVIIYVLMWRSCLTALAQEKPAETIVFKGSTDAIYNGSTIVIYNKVIGLVDSAKIINGGFAFTVPYKGPSRYFFYSVYEVNKKGRYWPFGIIVDNPKTVNITADMESMGNSVSRNAPENDLYNSFMSLSYAGSQKISKQMEEKFGVDYNKRITKQDPKYKEMVGYYDELNAANKANEAIRLETFIKLHSDSFTSIYLLNAMVSSMPADKAQALYKLIASKYKTTSYSTDIMRKISATKITATVTVIGKIAPDFEQPDTLGKIVKLSSFRGQYVLVDFWASWCMPCRAENPNVVKAYQQYHDKGFTVLSVSLDQAGKKEAWLNAIHQDHLTWTQVSDLQFWNNTVAKMYGIQSIPQNFLLDKDGKIIASNIRGEELGKKLSEIFHN